MIHRKLEVLFEPGLRCYVPAVFVLQNLLSKSRGPLLQRGWTASNSILQARRHLTRRAFPLQPLLKEQRPLNQFLPFQRLPLIWTGGSIHKVRLEYRKTENTIGAGHNGNEMFREEEVLAKLDLEIHLAPQRPQRLDVFGE